MIRQKHAIRAARFLVGLLAAAALGGCAHTTLNDLIHSQPQESANDQAVHERMAAIKARIAHLQSQLQQVKAADNAAQPATQTATETPTQAPAVSATAPATAAHPWQLVTHPGEEAAGRRLYGYVLFSAGNHPLSAVDARTRDSLAGFLDEVRALAPPTTPGRAPLFVVPADIAGADEQPALTNYNAALAAKLFDRTLGQTQNADRPAGMFLLVTPTPLGQLGDETPRLLLDCTSLPEAFRRKLLETVAAPVAPGDAAARLSALTWALTEATGPGTPTLTLRRRGSLVIADWLR